MNIAELLPLLPWEGLPLPKFLKLYWPWYKPAGVPKGEEPLAIEIYDQYGNRIASAGLGVTQLAPFPTLTEGDTITVRLTATNTSKKGAVPVPANFVFHLKVTTTAAGFGTIKELNSTVVAFAAGETKGYTFAAFAIPVTNETSPFSMTVEGSIWSAGLTEMYAFASTQVTLSVLPTAYGATILPPGAP